MDSHNLQLGTVNTDIAILNLKTNKNSESELGRNKSLPDLIIQQVGDEDSGTGS